MTYLGVLLSLGLSLWVSWPLAQRAYRWVGRRVPRA